MNETLLDILSAVDDTQAEKDVFAPGDIISVSSRLTIVISSDLHAMFALPRIEKDDVIILIEPANDHACTKNYETFQSMGPLWTGGVSSTKYKWWLGLFDGQLVFIDTSWGVNIRSKMSV